MDTRLKRLKNSVLRGHFVSKAHKNKIANTAPIVRVDFLMAIIFTSLGVAVKPEINMADKKSENNFSLIRVAHIPAM